MGLMGGLLGDWGGEREKGERGGRGERGRRGGIGGEGELGGVNEMGGMRRIGGVQEDCLRSTVYRRRKEERGEGRVGGKVKEGEDERGSSGGPE